ncbi:MAG TPA: MASE1 domain-containing protein [Geobacteraceae bacterium]|nr:MASE1 domain-containing protein [Geobacteraceae bacterium]
MRSFISNIFASKFGKVVIVAGAYYLVAKFCLLLALETTNATAIWPPTGIALAAVLLFGYRIWPAIALGAFFANLDTLTALGFTTPLALAGAFSTAIGNTLGVLFGGFLVLHFTGGRNPFGRTGDIVKFVLFGALLGMTVSAITGAGTLCILHGTWSNFALTCLTWWLGDAVAVLIITPLIMTWESRRKSGWTPLKLTEAAVILALLFVIGWVVFGKGLTLPYLFIPLLIWSAFRFGQFEAAGLIMLMLCLSIWGAVEGVFIYHGVSPNISLLLTQIFISVASIMTMLLISLLAERNAALADLRGNNEVLQHEIAMRMQAEEQKAKHEAQNRQIQKAESLGRMAGAIAHHFNNQLTAVIGNLELAMIKLPPDAAPLKNLDRAMQAASRAAEVSSLMLTYLGQTPGIRDPLDLSEACRRSLPILLAAMSKDLVLETDLPSPGPVVSANPNKIHLLLINLVTNAWEAVCEGSGAIHLAVNTVSPADIPAANRLPIDWQPSDNDYACLEVADAGCGIADEDNEKLFDPFFSSKFPGRGLGLPVVLGIVRAHRGAVTVESEPGRGSVFRVFLPLSEEEVLRQADKAAQAPEIEGGGTVLLVDDEEMVRGMAAGMLKLLGFTTLEAKDGVEAVELFRRHKDEIRCVLCDLTMPRLDGWETLAALRKITPGIPVILASGCDESQVMTGDHTEWPQAFLGKPYQIDGLRDALGRTLTKLPAFPGE